ncbi:MAG: Gfo/Idh/MocA family oxidoreductase, partial [Paracoccaceae bacterium]
FDFFMTRYTAAYSAEIAAFIDIVAGDAPVTPSGEDGLRSLVIAQAALTSVAEGRRIVIGDEVKA